MKYSLNNLCTALTEGSFHVEATIFPTFLENAGRLKIKDGGQDRKIDEWK